ncbi:MAG TPA: alpha/beta hydrolase [Burkholderiaceae bacterium]|nr:alpha/beta hydrolase [Burkholderiaceae bacterium]
MIATGQYAEVGRGIRLHYASVGQRDARPILFLHGFPEYWAAWEDVLPYFAAGWHAVAPDLRGFNLSSQPLEVKAYRARELVADFEGLSEFLGWTRLTVVAHDWGGAAAWQWAVANPERVERLVIVNSPHPVPFARDLANDPAQQAASAYMNWLRAPGSEEALVRHDCRALDSFFLMMRRADRPWYTAERAARYREVWRRGMTGPVNYYRASPLYPPTDDDPGARALKLDPAQFHVRAPTLVLWGEADPALPLRLLDGLGELVDELTIERFPQATHWIAHEEPKRIAVAIQGFCGAV